MINTVNLCNIGLYPYKIENKDNLNFINKFLKEYITGLINSVIGNIEPKATYVNNNLTFGFYCNSLLEAMYLQLFEDLENSKIVISHCEYCGRIIADIQKRKYCLMTEEEKNDYKTKSKCASNGGMIEKRKREAKKKTSKKGGAE